MAFYKSTGKGEARNFTLAMIRSMTISQETSAIKEKPAFKDCAKKNVEASGVLSIKQHNTEVLAAEFSRLKELSEAADEDIERFRKVLIKIIIIIRNASTTQQLITKLPRSVMKMTMHM